MRSAALFFLASFLAACGSHRAAPVKPQPLAPTFHVASEQAVAAFEVGPTWQMVSDKDGQTQLIFQHVSEPNGVMMVSIIDAPPGSTIEEATAHWWSLLSIIPTDIFTTTEKRMPTVVSEEESQFVFLGTLENKTPITATARIILVSIPANDAWVMVWTMGPTPMAAAMDAEALGVMKTLRLEPPE